MEINFGYPDRRALTTTISGVALNCSRRIDGEDAVLSFPLEAHGFGAILETQQTLSELSPEIQQLLTRMKSLSQQPLESFSSHWESIPQTLVPIRKHGNR